MRDLKPGFYFIDAYRPSQLTRMDEFPPLLAGSDYLDVGGLVIGWILEKPQRFHMRILGFRVVILRESSEKKRPLFFLNVKVKITLFTCINLLCKFPCWLVKA
jgi:hypothetical protein